MNTYKYIRLVHMNICLNYQLVGTYIMQHAFLDND